MINTELWQHKDNGLCYVVRLQNDSVVSAYGPTDYTNARLIIDNDYHFDSDDDTVDMLNEYSYAYTRMH